VMAFRLNVSVTWRFPCRNMAYQEPAPVLAELGQLRQEVERLRRQIHVLERGMLVNTEIIQSVAEDGTRSPLQDPLKLSPDLWSRLAFGIVQGLSKSDPPEFHAGIMHVCSVSCQDVSMDGEYASAKAAEPGVPRPDNGSEPMLDQTKLSTAEVVNQFCTHVAKGMIADGGTVDHQRLQAFVGKFRCMMLDACWEQAASEVPVSQELQERDKQLGVGGAPPGLRVELSKSFMEMHDRLQETELNLWHAQAELLESYNKLAKSGAESATLRKQVQSLRVPFLAPAPFPVPLYALA
jgi:hypothetical protein